jgi:hypothetical protein
MAAIEKGVRVVVTAVIVSDRLLQICPCARPIPDEGMGPSQRVVRLQKEPRILHALGQAKQLLCQIHPSLNFPARDVEETKSP